MMMRGVQWRRRRAAWAKAMVAVTVAAIVFTPKFDLADGQALPTLMLAQFSLPEAEAQR